KASPRPMVQRTLCHRVLGCINRERFHECAPREWRKARHEAIAVRLPTRAMPPGLVDREGQCVICLHDVVPAEGAGGDKTDDAYLVRHRYCVPSWPNARVNAARAAGVSAAAKHAGCTAQPATRRW